MRWIGQITYDEVAYFREDVIIEAGNKLGIGTNSPSYPLHVVTDSSSHAAYIKNTNNNGGGLVVAAANGGGGTNTILSLRDKNDSSKVVVIENGYVGIGTTSPASLLHVEGAVQIGVNDAGHDFTLYGDTANYNIMWDASSSRLEVNDNVKFNFGGGNDLSIYHTGSHSNILASGTGDLKITQSTDDQDIIFQCDDSSGGTTPYLTLDGGLGYTTVQKRMKFDDNTQLQFGNGGDLQFYHTGSVGVLYNNTGDFRFRQNANDKDIIFQSDDGSGGTTAYLTLDGSEARMNAHKDLRFDDNTYLRLGAGGDVKMWHNGTDSYIMNLVGDLHLLQSANDKDIILSSDDGSGGTTPYLTLDGSEARTNVHKNMLFEDSVTLGIGASYDLQLYHNGSTSLISNQNGNLLIRNQANDGDIVFQADDGSGGDATYLTLDGSVTRTIFSQEARFTDSISLKLGTGGDLQMYHDGSNSYIRQNGTGNLYIDNTTDDADVILRSDDGSGGTTAYLTLDGSVGYTQAHKTIRVADSQKIQYGDSGDLNIYHDSTNSWIINDTGDLYIRNTVDNKDIIFQSDDGAGGTATYFSLDGSAATHDGSATTNLQTVWPDNSRIVMGSGDDFYMRHSGSDFLMSNTTGTMAFYQQANDGDMKFYCDDGSGGNAVYLTLDGGAETVVVAKPLDVTNSTNSSDATGDTGAIRTEGGISVAGKGFFGGQLYAKGMSATVPGLEIRPGTTGNSGYLPAMIYRNNDNGSANYFLINGTTTAFAAYDGAVAGGVTQDLSKMVRIKTANSADLEVHVGDSGSTSAALTVKGFDVGLCTSWILNTSVSGVVVSGSDKIYTITHGMGSSRNYGVQVIRNAANSGNGETVYTDVTRTDTTIVITFALAPTAGNYTALVTKFPE